MAVSCIIGHPKVRGPKGNIVDSKLHKDLSKYLHNNRPLTDGVYYTTKNPKFIQRTEGILQYDENGEPTLESIKRYTDLLDQPKVVEAHKGINPEDDLARQYNEALNKKLRGILERWGVSVGTLTDLEQRMGIRGVTDYDQAQRVAEGLVELIRIAKGEAGEIALPEEFAHFVIDASKGNHLVDRIIKNIQDNNLARRILGEEYNRYSEEYKGDSNKLAREAAGKLLAKALFNKYTVTEVPKSLWQRFMEAIKKFISSWQADDITRAMNETMTDIDNMAVQILNDGLEGIDLKNLDVTGKLYSLEKSIDKEAKALQTVIETLAKRQNIYKRRSKSENFNREQAALIKTLYQDLQRGNILTGINGYLGQGVSEMTALQKKLISTLGDKSLGINAKCRVLRDVHNFISMHRVLSSELREALMDKFGGNDVLVQNAKNNLDQMLVLITNLEDQYRRAIKPLFTLFLKPYMGENIEIPFGPNKDKVYTLEQIISEADKDISFLDRWLNSMADSSDYFLKLMDQAVKATREKARRESLDMQKRILAAGIKLEQAGVKNTDWMYERDEKGNLTGNFIAKIDHAKFIRERKKAFEEIVERYKDYPDGVKQDKMREAFHTWTVANTEMSGNVRIPNSYYHNPQYTQAMQDPAKRAFYEEMLALYRDLNQMIPESYRSKWGAPRIRKDWIERAKDRGVSGFPGFIEESVKDAFVIREDDTQYATSSGLLDYEGNPVKVLPIFFTGNSTLSNMNDMSTDTVSTMIRFAEMAINYKHMSNVVDAIEIGKQVFADREIQITRGGKPLVQHMTVFGQHVTQPSKIKGKDSKAYSKLNDLIDARVYGLWEVDEGTIGKSNVSWNKTIHGINTLTSLNALAVNLLAGISNVATGTVMMRIESFCGEFFNVKDTTKADLIYFEQMPSVMAEIGNRVKTSKLELFIELFNVMQDREEVVRKVNFDRKTWFSRMFTRDTLYLISNCGEHWMHTRTALALANRYKLVSPMGNKVSLWDALEVVPIDPNNKRAGAKLQIKEGYKKEDGTEFTNQDIFKFSRKAAYINQRMHGIFNQEDMNALQRLALGKSALMFRRWIVASVNRRFKPAEYNFDLEGMTEGYYRTMGRVTLNLIRDLRKGQFQLIATMKNLNDTEKANLRRAVTELGHFIILATILALVDWDDDENRPWAMKMLEYQTKRLYTEVGAMIPSPSMFTEGLKIIQSPAAAVNQLESIGGILGLFWIPNYTEVIESGYFEGHTKAYKALFDSGFIPFIKSLQRDLDPDHSIQFFE